MFDFSKLDNCVCENQMTFDECLREVELYKWEKGQYINLPEQEEKENEHN